MCRGFCPPSAGYKKSLPHQEPVSRITVLKGPKSNLIFLKLVVIGFES